MYARFDGPRGVPRLPGPPYHFMTRIVAIEGPLGGMQPGSAVEAEYDVPPRPGTSSRTARPRCRSASCMEAALQPCGWLATYVGSARSTEADLLFRNLDGTGTRPAPRCRPGTAALRTRVELREHLPARRT